MIAIAGEALSKRKELLRGKVNKNLKKLMLKYLYGVWCCINKRYGKNQRREKRGYKKTRDMAVLTRVEKMNLAII